MSTEQQSPPAQHHAQRQVEATQYGWVRSSDRCEAENLVSGPSINASLSRSGGAAEQAQSQQVRAEQARQLAKC